MTIGVSDATPKKPKTKKKVGCGKMTIGVSDATKK